MDPSFDPRPAPQLGFLLVLLAKAGSGKYDVARQFCGSHLQVQDANTEHSRPSQADLPLCWRLSTTKES